MSFVFGIGVDILHVSRMEKVWSRHGQRLIEKILCEQEQEECLARAKPPARYLAKAFAAKEAFVKALGSGFAGVGHRDVGVVRDASGKPVLVYSEALRRRLGELSIGAGHVSLSDEGDVVVAMVVLERASR